MGPPFYFSFNHHAVSKTESCSTGAAAYAASSSAELAKVDPSMRRAGKWNVSCRSENGQGCN